LWPHFKTSGSTSYNVTTKWVVFYDLEWVVVGFALIICISIIISVVTIYATLGDEAVAHGINETEVEFIITDVELLPKLATFADRLTNVKYIVYIGEISKSKLLDFPKGIKMMSMNDVEDLGARPENGMFFLFYLIFWPLEYFLIKI